MVDENDELMAIRAEIQALRAVLAGMDELAPASMEVYPQVVDLPPDTELPYGIIAMWSGTFPPAGWVLCNGSNNTPDLRGRFIVAYGSGIPDYSYPGNFSEGGSSVGATGGFTWHGATENNHPAHELDLGHSHNLDIVMDYGTSSQAGSCVQPGSPIDDPGEPPICEQMPPIWCNSGGLIDGNTATLPHTGPYNSNMDTDNRPPFYTLAFIMYQG